MKRLNRIGKVAIVATVAIALLACAGYAFWSVTTNVDNNKITSGSMTMSVVDDGQTTITPIDIPAVFPGDHGLAATWKVTIGNCPSSGDDLGYRLTGVSDSVSLADNVQIALLSCTGWPYDYWLNADGTKTLMLEAEGSDTEAAALNHMFTLSAANNTVWTKVNGPDNPLIENQFRHLKVFYLLPEDCASDCHDDEAKFNIAVEVSQHH